MRPHGAFVRQFRTTKIYSDAFRDFNHLERYGINPTVTLKPDDNTKVKLSYEYFHDDRTADRGNPSQALPGGATRFNPTTPFAPNGDFRAFFGSPSLNVAQAAGARADAARPADREDVGRSQYQAQLGHQRYHGCKRPTDDRGDDQRCTPATSVGRACRQADQGDAEGALRRAASCPRSVAT